MIFLGKKVVLTGAGRGFGKTLAIKFAEAGAELFISARTLERAQATVQLLKELMSSPMPFDATYHIQARSAGSHLPSKQYRLA